METMNPLLEPLSDRDTVLTASACCVEMYWLCVCEPPFGETQSSVACWVDAWKSVVPSVLWRPNAPAEIPTWKCGMKLIQMNLTKCSSLHKRISRCCSFQEFMHWSAGDMWGIALFSETQQSWALTRWKPTVALTVGLVSPRINHEISVKGKCTLTQDDFLMLNVEVSEIANIQVQLCRSALHLSSCKWAFWAGSAKQSPAPEGTTSWHALKSKVPSAPHGIPHSCDPQRRFAQPWDIPWTGEWCSWCSLASYKRCWLSFLSVLFVESTIYTEFVSTR